jgi:ABC-type antimicrobial peptide transport system permease subunit
MAAAQRRWAAPTEVKPMRDVAGRLFRSWKLGAAVFTLFAVIALGVAGMGLYGLLSYEVAERRREIGIRVALGARRSAVLRFVLGGALATVAVGLSAGLAVSALGARPRESLAGE